MLAKLTVYFTSNGTVVNVSVRHMLTQERHRATTLGQLCAGSSPALTALGVKFQRAWRQVQVSIPC